MDIEERIKYKIQETQIYLSEIEKIVNLGYKTFSEDIIIKLASERLFTIVSQTILDICTQISSVIKSLVPENYSDCINILIEAGILKTKDKSIYRNLIKMRNLIVHQYGKIDYELLFTALTRMSLDFKRFSKLILHWLAEK